MCAGVHALPMYVGGVCVCVSIIMHMSIKGCVVYVCVYMGMHMHIIVHVCIYIVYGCVHMCVPGSARMS